MGSDRSIPCWGDAGGSPAHLGVSAQRVPLHTPLSSDEAPWVAAPVPRRHHIPTLCHMAAFENETSTMVVLHGLTYHILHSRSVLSGECLYLAHACCLVLDNWDLVVGRKNHSALIDLEKFVFYIAKASVAVLNTRFTRKREPMQLVSDCLG